jgi:hypothetical protein
VDEQRTGFGEQLRSLHRVICIGYRNGDCDEREREWNGECNGDRRYPDRRDGGERIARVGDWNDDKPYGARSGL